MWIYFVSINLGRMRWSRGRNCSVWSSTEQWSRGIMTSPRLLQDIIIIIIIITSCQNQEKMRDLAEKLFNTRCGVMVEKVNNRYYHCYYYWWLRRWEIIANIMSWREHKNIWITTIYTVNPNPRMTSLTWSWSQYLEAPPSSQNLFLSDSTTLT